MNFHGSFEKYMDDMVPFEESAVFHVSGFCDGQVFGGCQDCCGSTLVPLEKNKAKQIQVEKPWSQSHPAVIYLFSLGRF